MGGGGGAGDGARDGGAGRKGGVQGDVLWWDGRLVLCWSCSASFYSYESMKKFCSFISRGTRGKFSTRAPHDYAIGVIFRREFVKMKIKVCDCPFFVKIPTLFLSVQ